MYDADVQLNVPDGILVILLFLNIMLTFALEEKLSPLREEMLVIWLYDKSSCVNDLNLEIWPGTYVSWLKDAIIDTTGLIICGERKALRKLLSWESVTFWELMQLM